MELFELIKTVGSVASAIMGICALCAMVLKPIRQKIVSFVTNTSKNAQTEEALSTIKTELKAIRDENQAQTQKLNELQVAMDREREASKASLGNTIKHIYYQYSEERKLPIREVEALCLLHKAYKLENGNSFVDAIFDEMINEWEHTPD